MHDAADRLKGPWMEMEDTDNTDNTEDGAVPWRQLAFFE
jgi:hypothetical protein